MNSSHLGQTWTDQRSIAEPVFGDEYGVSELPEAPPVDGSSGRAVWVVALLGALALLAGGGYLAATAFAASGGASTPEEAVDGLFLALEDEDFLTAALFLEPSERRTVVDPVVSDIVPELIRLGVLDESFDSAGVAGLDLHFNDIEYRVETLAQNPDMVHVLFTAGESSSTFDADEFAFGSELRERFGDDLNDDSQGPTSLASDENMVVFVERDGRWYASVLFTAAEQARLDAGERLPRKSESPVALGSESPEQAVGALIEELVEMDLAGLIGRTDPEELAVLYRYSPLFLEDAQDGLDELRKSMAEANVTWSLDDLEYDVSTDGNDSVVTIRGFTFVVESEQADLSLSYGREAIAIAADVPMMDASGSIDITPTQWQIEGDSISIVVDIDAANKTINATGVLMGESFDLHIEVDETGDCSAYSVTAPGVSEEGCLEDETVFGGNQTISQLVSYFESMPEDFAGVPVATRRTDGLWYVSPSSTVMNGVSSWLSGLEKESFWDSIDSAQSGVFAGLGTAEGLLASGFMLGEDSFGTPSADFSEGSFESVDDFTQPVDVIVDNELVVAVGHGETVSFQDAIDVGTFDVLSVDLSAGDTVTITAEAGAQSDIDTTIEVFGPSGWVGYNDDALSDAGLGLYDSQLEIQVDDDGLYLIEVHSFGDFTAGSYSLTIERS